MCNIYVPQNLLKKIKYQKSPNMCFIGKHPPNFTFYYGVFANKNTYNRSF